MRGTGEGIVIVVIGVAAIWGASMVPPPPEGETWAGVLPMMAAVFLTLAGTSMAWLGSRKAAEKSGHQIAFPSLDHRSLNVLILIVLAVLYHQAIIRFGYELPTAAVGPLVLWLFGVRNKAGLLISILLYPVIFHLLFFKMLGVFPPLGTVFDLLEYLRG